MRDFNHTMDLLVRAYLNDTLKHNDCGACAVGNICGGMYWKVFFMTTDLRQDKGPHREAYFKYILPAMYEMGAALIRNSGYTVDELARVEYAFETAPRGEDADAWMFNGLLAVLEVLADIHGIDWNGQKVYEKQLEEIYATK